MFKHINNMFDKLKKDEIKEGTFYQAYLIPDVSRIEDVKKKFVEIAQKDASFSFAQIGKVFVMNDISKDKLHKRCLWLVKNVDGLLGYKISEIKITEDYIKSLIEDSEAKAKEEKRRKRDLNVTEGLE